MNLALSRVSRDVKAFLEQHKERLPYAVGVVLLLAVYLFSKGNEVTKNVYQNESKFDFKDARILGSQSDSLYEGKERLLTKTVKELQATQAALREANEKLNVRLEQIEKGKLPQSASTASGDNGSNPVVGPPEASQQEAVRVGAPPSGIKIGSAQGYEDPDLSSSPIQRRTRGFVRHRGVENEGSSIISFPVKDVAVERTESVVIPSGSYVKAKLMTGVEAPEGKTYPVLLQLDYAFIVPNKKKIDLSGCFMIAKSTGDLSIERVQMQTEKMSCVSKEGRMFERDVNGFIADDKDNSFAVIGSVNSKQDRVAAMAFLSSIVKGVGTALQQAQTSTQTSSGFGTQSNATNVTGSQMAYIAGGGASEAASQVTQWYLRQAQNLLPTINIGSGQNVWVVMKDSVKLPNDYFQKPMKGGTDNVYTYISRIVD